jgi:RHS repeat-associated protein
MQELAPVSQPSLLVASLGTVAKSDYRARYYDPTPGRFLSEDPLGFVGGDPNFYAYAANSTTNFVDPFGLIIGVIGDAQDRSDFNHALQYLKADPGMRRMIVDMQESDTLYTVITTHSMDADYTDVRSSDHVIVWNPHLGLKCEQQGPHEYGAMLSPAMALGHELAHQRHDSLAAFLQSIDIGDYENLEERRVIKNYENPAALTLGEGVRSDHFGVPEWVPTVLSKPACNCHSPAKQGRH